MLEKPLIDICQCLSLKIKLSARKIYSALEQYYYYFLHHGNDGLRCIQEVFDNHFIELLSLFKVHLICVY